MENKFTLPTPQLSFQSDSLKMFFLVVIGLILLSIAGVTGYYLGATNAQNNSAVTITPTPFPSEPYEGVACTMEAKICPDGSSVGRSGPNCEFSECPPQSNFKKRPVTISGVVVTTEAEAAINLAVQSYLSKKNITEATLATEQREVTFEVHKANSEWFIGMGLVTGSKNCSIQPGATECGLPGPSFLIIGHKVNDSWETGAEYTPEFKKLIQEAPESIVNSDQKSIYGSTQ